MGGAGKAMAASKNPKALDYYLVLDFEATCDDKKPPKPQEIIEFPVLMVNARTLETDAVFHKYVSPTAHPQLTPFCTRLTGITQAMVEGCPTLAETLQMFDTWYNEKGLADPSVSSAFVTCGNWDLETMLPSQCSYFDIPRPRYFNQWVNIKKIFERATNKWPKGMPSMLNYFGLVLEGRHHSGIDDCRNIARILTKLVEIYPNIQPTKSL